MPPEQEQRSARDRTSSVRAAAGVFLLLASAGCGRGHGSAVISSSPVVLRIGVGNLASDNPVAGVRQVAGNLSFEGLIRIGPDGRPRPWLAKSWTIAPDGVSVTLNLQPGAKFHDGTPATAAVVAEALRDALPKAKEGESDVKLIEPSADGQQIRIVFGHRSPFLFESLEALIKKPGAPTVGTGPFAVAGTADAREIRANTDYYLGRPNIDRIVVTSYPTIRAAWAALLRDNIDMLYEVGEGDLGANVFTFTRPYQYLLILNTRSPKLKSAAVRRALNAAIDRAEIVRTGFEGRATAASGLVWPQNWAVAPDGEKVAFDPQAAAAQLKPHLPLRFTCLVPTDYERIALVVQRQLAAVGVTMDVETVAQASAFAAVAKPTFEAVLTDIIGGASLQRPYDFWSSHGSANPGTIGNPSLDAAFDRVRNATSDDDYRAAVANLQKVTVEDPPAIYLAWGHRSRAISKRFDVPVEPGRDVLATIRLWKPVSEAAASRN